VAPREVSVAPREGFEPPTLCLEGIWPYRCSPNSQFPPESIELSCEFEAGFPLMRRSHLHSTWTRAAESGSVLPTCSSSQHSSGPAVRSTSTIRDLASRVPSHGATGQSLRFASAETRSHVQS
jgi:hypothetical protein